MKKITLLIIVLSFYQCIYCQDIITTKQGYQINSKVLEIKSDKIEYKNFDNLDGPTLTIKKSDVLKINYQNGTVNYLDDGIKQEKSVGDTLSFHSNFGGLTIKKNGKRLSSKEIRELYKDHPESLRLFKTGKDNIIAGNIIGIPSAFILGYQLGAMAAGAEANIPLLIVGGGGVISYMILSSNGNYNIKKSIKLYNRNINDNQSASLHFGLTNSGIGLCLRF